MIEQLTEEIERLQKVNHTCLRRERMKDEKWSSWVRAVFTMCCDPENAGAAPMEATSAMMMAVEQFIVGHHASVKEHEGQVSLPCDPLSLRRHTKVTSWALPCRLWSTSGIWTT